MDTQVSKFIIEEIKVGYTIVFEETITNENVDLYACLTGDISPLHVDPEFARGRGYPDRLAHGMLVSGLFSRVVGVYMPGENALSQSASVKYHAPVFPGETLIVHAEVAQVSIGSGVIVLRGTITNKKTGEKVASAKIQVGLTKCCC